jgi:hypothetical protein
MSNRIKYYIRNVLQNSSLNKYKFNKNKKVYNESISKSKLKHNFIVKRNFASQAYNNNNNNNDNNDDDEDAFIFMCILASSYFILFKNDK